MSRVLSSYPGPAAVPNTANVNNANNLSSGLSKISVTPRSPTNANLDWLEEAENEYNPNIMAKKREANYNSVLAAQAERAMAKQAGVGVNKMEMSKDLNPLALSKISKELQGRYPHVNNIKGKKDIIRSVFAPRVYMKRMTNKLTGLAGGKKKSAKRYRHRTIKKKTKY